MENIFSIQDASIWASKYLNKNVTPSNVSYLIQYGVIRKIESKGSVCVDKKELEEYYNKHSNNMRFEFDKKIDGLNWHLSFDKIKEAETTKHVHRLHPYKGKFIPQLVEYFLNSHTDDFKQEACFNENDIILDPFAGSGTTLVEANENGINAIGVDVSRFNTIISNTKIGNYDIENIKLEGDKVTKILNEYLSSKNISAFDEELLKKLSSFNSEYFPVPDFKYKVRRKIIDGKKYGEEKEEKFLSIYNELVNKYNIKLKNDNDNTFIEKWTNREVYNQIKIILNSINNIKNKQIKELLTLILSRTMRSCRATTHADLATLKKPVLKTYYCAKHGKMCKPLFSILKWWQFYLKDTINRFSVFYKIKTNTYQTCLTGDSRNINIEKELEMSSSDLFDLYKKNKIAGIFSSPPYIGLIDYHEQHAYAYELFDLKRNDDLEIGPLFKGQGIKAREEYIEGISKVLLNSKKYLIENYNIFLVANDKYNMYPEIANRANMKIVKEYKRPVLNRTERGKSVYFESIFHFKEKI